MDDQHTPEGKDSFIETRGLKILFVCVEEHYGYNKNKKQTKKGILS